jgi:Domain of unknown function (DUF6894)
MARYFFHVVGAGSTFPDEAGRSFPTLQDAEAHAAVIAGELSDKHENYHSWSTDSGRRQLRRRRPTKCMASLTGVNSGTSEVCSACPEP